MFVTRRRPAVRDAKLRALRRRLLAISLQTELLSELMGFGHFAEMAMTRDGLLIGRLHGEAGFDAFIGPVSHGMRQRTARLWQELDAEQRQLVLARLQEQSIEPERIGIPAMIARTATTTHPTNGGTQQCKPSNRR